MESFFLLYLLFKNIPKGENITKPEGLIFACNLSANTIRLIGTRDNQIFFTRRSIKHFAEKGNDTLTRLLCGICMRPDEIRIDKEKDRYLLIKYIKEKGGRPYVVCIEIKKGKLPIIITAFPSDKKYLSNFDLLWRTGAK